MCSAECRPGDEGGAYLHTAIYFSDPVASRNECRPECRPGDEGGAYLHTAIFFRIVSLPETEAAMINNRSNSSSAGEPDTQWLPNPLMTLPSQG